MLPVSLALPDLDTDLPAADLARLNGRPREPEALDSRERKALDDLCAAVGAYTGFGAASPRTAEIVDVVLSAVAASLTAATALERAPSDSAAVPHMRNHDPRYATSADVPAWQDLAAGRRPLHAVRKGIQNVARGTPTPPANGQVCGVFAVDIAGFTRRDRDDDIRRHLHEKLYQVLRTAFNDSGIPWDRCFREDRGDGVLIVIPPELSVKPIIDPLPGKLRTLIRRHNHVSCEAGTIQLRAAAHIGPVDHDSHGFVGTDINLLFRMLEARPVKRMLAATGTELALVVSDYVYQNIVCRYPSLAHPDTFHAVRFQTKDTRARAWTYLPGASS
jgi:hypothetical protein